MKVRIQLSRPHDDAPADRRRLRVLLDELPRLGHDVALYRPGEAFDVLILGQTQEYAHWARVAQKAKKTGGRIIVDATNDVFAGAVSAAFRARYGRFAFVASPAARVRRRLQWWLRLGNWGHAPRLWKSAAAIVAGSPLQAERYRRFNPNLHAIVDAVLPQEMTARAHHQRRRPGLMVWEGSRDNIVNLRPFAGVWSRLRQSGVARLRVVTDRERSVPIEGTKDNVELLRRWDVEAEFVPWKPKEFASRLSEADVAVAPLPPSDPFSYAKPSNKLLNFASVGLPVVCSPVPSYRDELSRAEFGLLAASEDEWVGAVTRLVDDPALRSRMGEKGRAHALVRASPRAFAKQYDQVLSSLP